MFNRDQFILTPTVFLSLTVGVVLFIALIIWGIVSFISQSNTETASHQLTNEALLQTSSELTDDDSLVATELHEETLLLMENTPDKLIDVEKSATFETITVFLDGKELPIDARPFSYETRVYLPLRQVGEALNVNIGWNDAANTAIVESPTTRLELPVGYRKAIRIHKADPTNADLLRIDATSLRVGTVLYNNITYLPIRFTAEALGYNVKFDDANGTVHFTSPVK